ncbi:hypothetical protein [Paludisphaera borealis]|uniref:Uncharacterized protein n=1 Tax=Paludisphaera borealis TaxID=1387353 RepID=A0A1U7CTZ9_9BACT|nr:hypothetical protein [Paludisphaera borealis]APW62376.1 hypothetical protein BSF38_03915 [Paludisphaera borealis]
MLQETVSRSNIALADATARERCGSCIRAAGVMGTLSSFELAERLVQVWIRSDQHLRTLDDLNDKLAVARRYLASATPHRALAGAYLERLRDKRTRCLAHLRSERRTALALMKESDERATGGRRRACGA